MNELSRATCSNNFRYKGRMYDTCITLDYGGKAWCSIGTDENDNHVKDYWKECDVTCPVSDCPIGFYRMWKDKSCYQVRFRLK